MLQDWVLKSPGYVGKGGSSPSWYICTSSSLYSYLRTKFARFLVSLRKISQDAPRGVYGFVPQQEWEERWTDEKLYEKYVLSTDEIAYIESMIRPMGAGSE